MLFWPVGPSSLSWMNTSKRNTITVHNAAPDSQIFQLEERESPVVTEWYGLRSSSIHQVCKWGNVSTPSYSLKTHPCIFFFPPLLEEWHWRVHLMDLYDDRWSANRAGSNSRNLYCILSSYAASAALSIHPSLQKHLPTSSFILCWKSSLCEDIEDGCNRSSWRYGCMIRSPAKRIDTEHLPPTFGEVSPRELILEARVLCPALLK